MIKQFFVMVLVLMLNHELLLDKAHADIIKTSYNMVKTSYGKIEYLTSQTSGLGYGRPGTEDFLNADVIVKLKDDDNIYGLNLTFFDVNGPNKAMFDTLLAALINDLKVEIYYYDKAGPKQIARVTVRK